MRGLPTSTINTLCDEFWAASVDRSIALHTSLLGRTQTQPAGTSNPNSPKFVGLSRPTSTRTHCNASASVKQVLAARVDRRPMRYAIHATVRGITALPRSRPNSKPTASAGVDARRIASDQPIGNSTASQPATGNRHHQANNRGFRGRSSGTVASGGAVPSIVQNPSARCTNCDFNTQRAGPWTLLPGWPDANSRGNLEAAHGLSAPRCGSYSPRPHAGCRAAGRFRRRRSSRRRLSGACDSRQTAWAGARLCRP